LYCPNNTTICSSHGYKLFNTPKEVLIPADVEGRNAVYTAQQGLGIPTLISVRKYKKALQLEMNESV